MFEGKCFSHIYGSLKMINTIRNNVTLLMYFGNHCTLCSLLHYKRAYATNGLFEVNTI